MIFNIGRAAGKTAVALTVSIALAFGTAGVANASTVRDVATVESSEVTQISYLEAEKLADQIEILFTEYLHQDTTGRWLVTESGVLSDIATSELESIAASLNGEKVLTRAGVINKPMINDYAKCVINATGLGTFVGLFTGAFVKLIERQLWKQAAIYIVKLVGMNAIKGGVVGLAGTLAGSAIWCVTPWSK